MPTRRALLIASPEVPGQSNLPGARRDVERFQDFLLSPYGGTWLPGEIETLFNPQGYEVEAALERAGRCDYGFVTFSGHGEHHIGKGLSETSVLLNFGQSIYVYQLNPGCKRQTVVVDACRGVVYLTEMRKSLEGLVLKDASVGINPQACRRLFDEQLEAAEQGRVAMYSCGLDQSAGETADGGYFSRFLVEEAVSALEASRSTGNCWVPQDMGFKLAKAKTFERNRPQSPEFEPGRRLRQFPLAVAAYW